MLTGAAAGGVRRAPGMAAAAPHVAAEGGASVAAALVRAFPCAHLFT